MIGKTKFQNIYEGPRALFDPNYVPPELLFRKKEQNSLLSILKDSLNDAFSLNLLYQGIEGIGKKVLVNKVLSDLQIKNKQELAFQTIKVNCKEKSLEELIVSIIAEMVKNSNINFDLNSILNSKVSHLWNTFKLLSKKIGQDKNIIFIFNNIENINPEIFKKFLLLGKELNTTTISTVNNISKASILDLLTFFDQKKKLNFFTYNELLTILKQRIALTFSYEIEIDILEYITDLIFENYVPVPGKGIDIIRDIYPILKEKKNLSQVELLDLTSSHFDNSTSLDEFNMLNFVFEEDFLTVIFLDNLSNFFINKSVYYMTSNELKDLYDSSCELIEYEKDITEFNNLVEKLQRIGIIKRSKKSILEGKYTSNDPLNCVYFFTSVNPHQLKAVIDVVFGQF